MADAKISDLAAILAANVQDADRLELNDISAVDNLSLTIGELKKVIADYGAFHIQAATSGLATNIYIDNTNATPIVLPFDCSLIALTTSAAASATWTVEIHQALTLVPGAFVTASASDFARDATLNTNFNQDAKIQVYINGTSINQPRVNMFFKRR